MHPYRQSPHTMVHMPCVCMFYFVSRALLLYSGGGGGAREPSLGVCSLAGARVLSRAAAYILRKAEGTITHTALRPLTVPPMSFSWLPAGITVTCIQRNGEGWLATVFSAFECGQYGSIK